ncbi:MAG: hypothetical protein JXR36_02130 [Bacteroidales bacterium]|nr:hypothetical protein [Bacteroidales bacterium]
MKTLAIILISILTISNFSTQSDTPCKKKKNAEEKEIIVKNSSATGYEIEIEFTSGKGHNNPSFAIWIEDMNEQFVQELFVTQSVATGIFRFGDASTGQWQAGQKMYKATLPYFIHKHSQSAIIPNKNNPITDAYTGATPSNDFILKTKSNAKIDGKFRIVMEINQAWDSNNYWNNAKYPDEKEYKNSLQPSLVYAVTIDPKNLMDEYTLNPIGHGHYAGKNGNLFTDLSTFTTALRIAQSIKLKIKI